MLFVDDLTVVLVLQRVGTVLLLDLGGHGLDKGVLDRALTKHVVGSHAGLPAVEIFSKDDALGRKSYICTCVHDAGTFASQLQDGGREMLGGAAKHLPAHGLTPREEDEIKFLIQQSGVFGSAAGHHGNVVGSKALPQDLFYDP